MSQRKRRRLTILPSLSNMKSITSNMKTNVNSKITDVLTNRKYIHARVNEYNQMRMATIQTEQAFCQTLNSLMAQKLPSLERILMQEINESYMKPDMQNSIKGTIQIIIGDILTDENTKEILLKHLRSGCLKDDHAEQEIEKKQRILADLKERDFLNKLNASIPMIGGDAAPPPATENLEEQDYAGLEIDSEDAIANAVCDVYKRLFKSWPNSLKSTAVDAITRVIKTNPEIQSSINQMIVTIVKKTFQANTFREVFIKQLEGGCYKPLSIRKESLNVPQPVEPVPSQSPIQETVDVTHGGTKKRLPLQNRKTQKKQKGGHEEITRLSFDTLAKNAFPNIKACMCDKIKTMYTNTTPEVFKNYSMFFKSVIDDPSLIENAKEQYATFLDHILHTPNTQIKIDIRKHINGECPPLEDPELRFVNP